MPDTSRWLNLIAAARQQSLEQLEAWFQQQGAVAVTVVDAGDEPIFEPRPGQTPVWKTVQVTGLFDGEASVDDLTLSLNDAGFELVAAEVLEDRIWEREWLARFAPMQFGKRLWVCPHDFEGGHEEYFEGGHEEHSEGGHEEYSEGGRERDHESPGENPSTDPPPDLPPDSPLDSPPDPPPEKVVVRLDPGLAFGTGTHETTRLCLEYLDAASLKQKSVIDYGCGSGLLAVAAALLGAEPVLGVDIDPQAIAASRMNAAQNNVSATFALVDEANLPALQETGVDLVIANILAEPLIELSQGLSSLVAPGGTLVLSGIMESQSRGVQHAYLQEQGSEKGTHKKGAQMMLEDEATLGGWVRLVFRRVASREIPE